MPARASDCTKRQPEPQADTDHELKASTLSSLQQYCLVNREAPASSDPYAFALGPVFVEPQKQRSSLEQIVGGFTEMGLQAPQGIRSQLIDDLNNRPGEVACAAGTAALFGATVTTLLRRSPFVTQAALCTFAGLEGLNLAYSAAGHGYSLGTASTPEEYRLAVANGVNSLSREGANMLEAFPAMGAGSMVSYKLTPKISALDRLSMKVCQNVEYPARALAPDSLFWSGPGTKKLPDSLRTPSGNINIKAVTDELYTAHPWNGVEEGRYFDMAKMKLSRNYSGQPDSILVPGGKTDLQSKVLTHTHPPEYSVMDADGRMLEGPSGSIPSFPDISKTHTPFGIITSGSKSTIYMNSQAEILANGLETDKSLMKALMFDRDREIAVLINGVWTNNKTTNLLVGRAEYLDYERTLARLSDWDMEWKSLNEIPRFEPKNYYQLFPKMTPDGYFVW